MQQETNSKIAKQASSIVTKLATTMTATEARVVCRAKASNIKDASTERGRDPVRRKSVVCGE